MGLIARHLAEVRDNTAWLTDDGPEEGRVTSSGVRVTRAAALGLTTVWRCVDLLSSAVALSPKDVYLKVGGQTHEQYAKPAWMAMPNPNDPTYTIDDYFIQTVLALLMTGNYFTHVYPYVWAPEVLTALDPTRVRVKAGPLYDLLDERGKVTRTVGPMEMLHGTWLRLPGALTGISPLETLRRGFGGAVAAEEHAGRFFGQGAAMSFGVEVPYTLTEEKREKLRGSLRAKYAGLRNSHAIGVLSDGAKFVTGLAPTPEQAQMLATRKFSVEDLCRPYGVPPAMAGSTEPGAASFASTSTYDKWFQQRAVLPLTGRLETQHERLLALPPGVSDTSAAMQFRFNLDWILQADILARFQAYGMGVQNGILKPDEARGKENLAPAPGGDRLYMQTQMVPIDSLGAQPPAAPARSLEVVA